MQTIPAHLSADLWHSDRCTRRNKHTERDRHHAQIRRRRHILEDDITEHSKQDVRDPEERQDGVELRGFWVHVQFLLETLNARIADVDLVEETDQTEEVADWEETEIQFASQSPLGVLVCQDTRLRGRV